MQTVIVAYLVMKNNFQKEAFEQIIPPVFASVYTEAYLWQKINNDRITAAR